MLVVVQHPIHLLLSVGSRRIGNRRALQAVVSVKFLGLRRFPGLHFQEVRDINPQSKIVLVGNKMDMPTEETTLNTVNEMATTYECPVFFTSAKTGENVDSMFQTLAQSLV